jgi:Na+-transporting methylmalonyl-CoA/oxaloacetate decarboxylase beta subunit
LTQSTLLEDRDSEEHGNPTIGLAVISATPTACAAAVNEAGEEEEPDMKSDSSSS